MKYLAEMLENHYHKHGEYPKVLVDIDPPMEFPNSMRIYDIGTPKDENGNSRVFYYEPINSNQKYLLFSLGKDGKPFTEDDAFPDLTGSNGWQKYR